MLRSMYTSIGGLKNHQILLDTTANNISNVNTYGFKASKTSFKDMLSQTMQGASAPTAILGGTNARQVGLGMQLDSITQIHTQGNFQATGAMTDLGITGDGFFRITPDITNLSAVPPTAPPVFYTRAGNFNWDSNGSLVTSEGYHVLGFVHDPLIPGPDTTQETVLNVDWSTTRSVVIGSNGRVDAIDTNGVINPIGWISMSKFSNPSGLTSAGGNKWAETANSGLPVDGTPGDATGMGLVTQGVLEMSNVDLATEFTEMIRAQRGFQANSRVITTSDEILQELVNLKR